MQVCSNNDSSGERLQLFDKLQNLLDADFEQLIFALNPPPGIIPPPSEKQSLRVSALLTWAQNSSVLKLDEIKNLLNLILGLDQFAPRKGAIEITFPIDNIEKIDPIFLNKILLFSREVSSKSSILIHVFDENEERSYEQ